MSKVKYTNKYNIPLFLAVMLVDDTYDYVINPDYLSATSILKPTRQLILERRVEESEEVTYVDLSELIHRATGTSFHDSVERAWVERGKINLMKLGISEEEANSYLINPKPEDIEAYIRKYNQEPNTVYLERRGYKTVGKYTVGGKFDAVINGQLNDIKETSTHSLTSGTKDNDYINQGSIYRWLHQDIVKGDTVTINFKFKNHMPSLSGGNNEYPEISIGTKDYPLKSITNTELYIRDRIKAYDDNKDLPEEEIIECPESELWLDPPKYKYFVNRDTYLRGGNCQRSFDSQEDANAEKIKRGKGIVVPEYSTPKRCLYCKGYNLCSQKDKYFS